MQLRTIEASFRQGTNSVVRAGHRNGKIEMLAPKTQLWLDVSLSAPNKALLPQSAREALYPSLTFPCHHLLHSLTHPKLGPATLTLKDAGNCLSIISDCHHHRFFVPTSLESS